MTLISKHNKKVLRWGRGLAVLITTEAKRFGWDETTEISVEAVDDGKEKQIILKKLEDK